MPVDLRLSAEITADSAFPFNKRLQVTVKNVGPMAWVNLGTIVKDADVLPNLKVSLNKEGKRYDVVYRGEFRFANGKVFPLSVVLPNGSSYSFDLPFKDYVVILTGTYDPDLDRFAGVWDEIRVEMRVEAEDYKFWPGKDCDLLPCWTGSLATTVIVQ